MAATPGHASDRAMRSEASGSIVGVKVSEREKTVLLAFAALGCNEEGYSIYFRTIATHTKLDVSQVRRSTRSLARKGLTELNRGLFDDDGFVAGSGYALTSAGWSYARATMAHALGPSAHGALPSDEQVAQP